MKSGSRQPPWKMSHTIYYSVFTDTVLWVRLGSEPDFLDQLASNRENRSGSSSGSEAGSSFFNTVCTILANLYFKMVSFIVDNIHIDSETIKSDFQVPLQSCYVHLKLVNYLLCLVLGKDLDLYPDANFQSRNRP
jgi:hypothetical protein